MDKYIACVQETRWESKGCRFMVLKAIAINCFGLVVILFCLVSVRQTKLATRQLLGAR